MRTIRTLFVCVAALGLLASNAHAGGSVDVALTDQSLRAEHGAVRQGTAAYLTVGGWYHMNNGQMAMAGFHAIDPERTNRELTAGLGGKAYLFKASGHENSIAIGLGGFMHYQPEELNGFGGEVAGYFAPEVLSFSDLTEYYDLQIRATYEVLPQGRVFVGYSNFVAYYDDNSEVTLDDAITLGFRVRY